MFYTWNNERSTRGKFYKVMWNNVLHVEQFDVLQDIVER